MTQRGATPRAAPLAGDDEMPMLGLGTWENDDLDQCAESVEAALDMGYRHVDTAQIYRNEAAVGRGIENADVDREDVFLATKVWISELSSEDAIESTYESLEKLRTDYVDLLYVHWPAGAYEPATTLAAFDRLVDEGAVDRIGVSNFEPHHVEEATALTEAPVFANQVELHPLLQQPELREHAADHDYELVAYSPLARGGVFDVPEVSAVAERHGVSEPQVALAWLREQGVTAIPKATSEGHLRDNWASLGLDLSAEDLAAIDDIGREERRVDPDFGPESW